MKADDVREQLRKAHRELVAAKDEFNRITREIMQAMNKIRANCDHDTTRTYCMGTPYDSGYYECDACGTEFDGRDGY